MKLPNLKALWLNENPVATNCANFNIIGDHFDKLEIFNSQLTSKAGEWAMLYYARDSGAKTLEEITSLDLSGKNLLMVEDISFLKKLTNLKHLDIGNNVDMYKPDAMLEAEAMQAAKGSGQENMDFKVNIHNRDVLLHNIPPVEHLICDIMLEAYILDTREHRHFLPNLKTINRVAIDIKDLGERTKIKKNLKIMDDVWKFIGTYRLVKPGVMDEEPCFYVMDEVGNSIDHSDKPNMRMAPLIYSPNNKADDPAAYTYSIVWPIEDVQKEHYLTRDFLQGITEAEWRSARLFPWFNVYEEYYQQEYQKFLDKKPDFNALERHEQYQTEYPSQSVIDWDVTQQGPIPV
jgi:tubulin--tyrosine ligase-like protein 12